MAYLFVAGFALLLRMTGVLDKVSYGEAPTKGPNPYTTFDRKKKPFHVPTIYVKNGTPFTSKLPTLYSKKLHLFLVGVFKIF